MHISLDIFRYEQLQYIAAVLVLTFLLALIPSLAACKRSLSDGLSMRL